MGAPGRTVVLFCVRRLLNSLYWRMRSAYVGVKLFGSRPDIPPDHRSPACQKIGTYHLAGIGRPALRFDESKRLRYLAQTQRDSATRDRTRFGIRSAHTKLRGYGVAVLKITITETPEELRWILQGRLAEPWVTEVKASWKEARRNREGHHCVVDLTNVTCVGKGGEELLRSMSNEGAQFIASGFYIKDVLQELKNCR
jgi:hypothetical protein